MKKLPIQYHHGYRHGLQQPGQKVKINLSSLPDNIDFDLIDSWLENYLELKMEPEPVNQIIDPESRIAFSILWRILLIGRYLQQIARIPVFDIGVILEVRRKIDHSFQWESIAFVPVVDNLSLEIVGTAYRSSMAVMNWVLKNYRVSGTPVKLYKAVEENVLKSLTAMVRSGISTIPVLRVAHLYNLPVRHLGTGIYQLGWGRKSRLIDRSSVDSDSVIGSKIANNKFSTALVLRAAGFPAPDHIVVSNADQAASAAAKLGWPLVVKPADRERGEGVTVAIRDRENLLAAYKTAAALSKVILIEREVPGVCYRLLLTNGKLLYAIRRNPRSIEGDGKHTVAQLVRRVTIKNSRKPPWLMEKPYPLDKLALTAISSAGFNHDSIPEKGVWVPLRRIESTAWGGHIEDVSELVHPENRIIAERAARLFCLTNAGIDIISTDIAKPWYENGAIINEVNYAPYFGGNDIAKSLIPFYLEKLMDGDGRIPVEVVFGSDPAMKEGRSRQQAFIDKNVDCYLTSHNLTLTASAEPLFFPFESLFNRAAALLMNKNVEALILVVQTDELLKTGLPVDRFDRLIHVSDDIADWRDPQTKVSSTVRQELLQQLSFHIKACDWVNDRSDVQAG
ncbi:MAG: carboxylate--amine ligase [Deltaproteobacteria bacterium]|nr:carboxylate--amine ligase [Deltaproteobacteria bacterium]